VEEDFKLKYALSKIILACWKINPIIESFEMLLLFQVIVLNSEIIQNLPIIVIITVYAFINKNLLHYNIFLVIIFISYLFYYFYILLHNLIVNGSDKTNIYYREFLLF